jgi:hypothetical protein
MIDKASSYERPALFVENVRSEACALRKKASSFRRLANSMIVGGDFQNTLIELAAEYERKAVTIERRLAAGAAAIY